MDSYCIVVPCKTYIKKYFSALYGEILKPSMETDFGDSVITKLINAPIRRISKQKMNILFQGFDDTIKISVPIDFLYRLEHNPSNQNIYILNRYLENVFKGDLFVFVNIATCFGVDRKVAIETFANRYAITLDEDITYQALKKIEYRLRTQKSHAQHFLVTLSSNVAVRLTA